MSNFQNIIYLTSANASSVNLAQGSANWILNPPIQYDRSQKLKVAVQNFSYTNFFTNISAALANNTFTVKNNLAGGHTYTVVIPDGSYSVDDLSSTINNGLINQSLATGLVVLTPNYNTGTVIFTLSTIGWQISFPAGSPYVLLGTNLAQTIPAGGAFTTIANYSENGPNQATFNSILGLYVHTSLTNNSIFNGIQSNILYQSTPTADIGSIQSDSPFFPLWIDASTLSGSSVNNISVYITDQNNNMVTLADNFSLSIIVNQVN